MGDRVLEGELEGCCVHRDAKGAQLRECRLQRSEALRSGHHCDLVAVLRQGAGKEKNLGIHEALAEKGWNEENADLPRVGMRLWDQQDT
jgi:hypothetical protein